MKKILFSIVFFVGLCFSKPLVTVSIPAQEYFLEKISGDTLEVLVMVDPLANHETYEPKPDQMKKLSNSVIYFTVGLPFEDSWMKRFVSSSPNMKVVHTDKNIKKIEISGHHHEHDDDHHDLDHAVKDPHIWLDPILIKQQVSNMAMALSEVFPENKDMYLKNLEDFDKELDELNETLTNKLSKLKNRDFLIFHPSWGYFASRYNLNQIPIEIEGKEPKAADLVKIMKIAKEKNIKILFSEPQVPLKNANLVAHEIGAKVYIFDPLKKDVSKNLIDFADTLLSVN